MSNPIQDIIAKQGYLLADGAMGTSLFNLGLITGDAPELWNIDQPERITQVHQGFIDAGSDLILTNSFGGSAFRLKLHKSQDRVFELNKAAAQIARETVDKVDRKVIVAGDIGPTGELLIPLGEMTVEAAEAAFFAQAEGLKAGGADVFWIETMSSKEEIESVIRGAGRVGLPMVCTMTFDTAGKTMMGVSPKDAYSFISSLAKEFPIAAIGANCGTGPGKALKTLHEMIHETDQNNRIPIVLKANCGIPSFKNGQFSYTGTPELMADYARYARRIGAEIIGGCCGSTHEVIGHINSALKLFDPLDGEDHSMIPLSPSQDDINARFGLEDEGTPDKAADNAAPKRRRRR